MPAVLIPSVTTKPGRDSNPLEEASARYRAQERFSLYQDMIKPPSTLIVWPVI
ncbi:hypothetical protein GGQ73_004635 [Rhizobium skierniewicense]|uniref:Uncharacterized protein n=1 Tax=Rhizobium skierniewicense TaxID=984260 RepID=A0A7W6CH88_9HYPH|nr:hypothetical protein [Rhizobium skierniewicense]